MAIDQTLFLKQLIRDPANIGAIVPSSRALGRRMAQEIDPANGPTVEIGPGTGAITRQILAAGVLPDELTLFEMNPDFCQRLSHRFPAITVHNRMAQDMDMMGIRNLGSVISGLPLLNMPTKVQRAIANSVFTALKPGAPFIQFTYGPKPPLARKICMDLGLEWHKSKRLWQNLPPATVYVFRQL